MTKIKKITKLMKKLGITKYRLAKELDLNESTLSRVFSGKISPKLELVEKIENYILNNSYQEAYLKYILQDVSDDLQKRIESLQAMKTIHKIKFSESESKYFDLFVSIQNEIEKSGLIEIEKDEAFAHWIKIQEG